MSTIGSVSSMAGMVQPQVVSGASMRMPPSQKMANLFKQIDTNNSGTITKAQFEQAFQNLNPPPAFKAMGADAVFSKLDPTGSGSVSRQDFINGMKSMMTSRPHHPAAQAGAQPGADFSRLLAGNINAMNSIGTGNQAQTQTGRGNQGGNINIYA